MCNFGNLGAKRQIVVFKRSHQLELKKSTNTHLSFSLPSPLFWCRHVAHFPFFLSLSLPSTSAVAQRCLDCLLLPTTDTRLTGEFLDHRNLSTHDPSRWLAITATVGGTWPQVCRGFPSTIGSSGSHYILFGLEVLYTPVPRPPAN